VVDGEVNWCGQSRRKTSNLSAAVDPSCLCTHKSTKRTSGDICNPTEIDSWHAKTTGQAKPATPPGHSKNATFETVSLHFQSFFYFVYLPKIRDVNVTLKNVTVLSLEGVLGWAFGIWGFRKEDRKRNRQSITISTPRF
jgi:hypothetical protein